MPTLFSALKASALPSWQAYTQHEFVRQLGDGSLPGEHFIHYLKQDYVFLVHFSRAWALAAVKTDRIDEMRHAAATVNALVNHEMRLHVETCAARGVSEAQLNATEEAPENMAYTRFVIDAGLRGDLLDLLVALSPCVMGYGEIGARLAAEAGMALDDHAYGSWIATYSGAEYKEVCVNAEALLDTVAHRLIGLDHRASPRFGDLSRTFKQACELEAGFWSMGLRGA
jgi:thiaminase/transcriptional activator TenA